MNNKKYKWDLSFTFKNQNEFSNALIEYEKLLIKLASFKDKLDNKKKFNEYLEIDEQFDILSTRLGVYLYKYYLDTTDEETIKLKEKLSLLAKKYMPSFSWVSKQTEQLGLEKILNFIKNTKFDFYKFYFEDFFRLKEHILPEETTNILSKLIDSRGAALSVYESLTISDYTDPIIKYNEKKIKLTQKKYLEIMEFSKPLEDQKLRAMASKAFSKKYVDNKYTFFEIYKSFIQRVSEDVELAKFKSPLNRVLHSENIPQEVFFKILEVGEKTSYLTKSYSNLYKQVLKNKFNLKKVYSSDSRLEIFKYKNKFTVEEAKAIVLKVAKKVSKEYYEAALVALKDGRVDYFESTKKVKGAFCTATSIVDPIILMNFNNDLDSVLTLAHEVGHSIHSILSNKTQPIPYQGYSIYLAEIASFTLESLVLDEVIEAAKTKQDKMYLLSKKIDHFLSCFTRQLQFAYFEHNAITKVFNKEVVTIDDFANIWKESIFKYSATPEKKSKKDDYKYKWAAIPHFFGSEYYVYQYSTSIVASMKFVADIKNNKPDAFVNLLKTGSSKYPNQVLLDNGIDLSTNNAYADIVYELESSIDNLKDLVKTWIKK